MRARVGLVLGLLAMAATGLAQDPAPFAAANPATLRIPDVFHVVGVAGLSRDEKLTLILDDTGLTYEKKKKAGAVVAYGRVRGAEIVSGERQHVAYVAGPGDVGATGALASLVFAKKKKLDMLVLDVVNERGGRMGLVLLLPLGKGTPCRDWLTRHGVTVTEPEIERTKEVLREGEQPLDVAAPTLKLVGTVTEFKAGSRMKRHMIGFGAGKTVIKAHVQWIDKATGGVVFEDDVDGKVILGYAGGDSIGATSGLAHEVAKVTKKEFFASSVGRFPRPNPSHPPRKVLAIDGGPPGPPSSPTTPRNRRTSVCARTPARRPRAARELLLGCEHDELQPTAARASGPGPAVSSAQPETNPKAPPRGGPREHHDSRATVPVGARAHRAGHLLGVRAALPSGGRRRGLRVHRQAPVH